MLLLLLSLFGCSDAAYTTDLDNLCHAAERSGADKNPDSTMKAQIMAEWMQKNITSSDGKALFKKMAAMSSSEKSKFLLRESKSHGIADCPIATMQ